MNDIVVIGAVVLVGGVILYPVISTTTGVEEDLNNNYIPDWMERLIGPVTVTAPELISTVVGDNVTDENVGASKSWADAKPVARSKKYIAIFFTPLNLKK